MSTLGQEFSPDRPDVLRSERRLGSDQLTLVALAFGTSWHDAPHK
jgi:hypothetical protein